MVNTAAFNASSALLDSVLLSHYLNSLVESAGARLGACCQLQWLHAVGVPCVGSTLKLSVEPIRALDDALAVVSRPLKPSGSIWPAMSRLLSTSSCDGHHIGVFPAPPLPRGHGLRLAYDANHLSART